MPRLNCALHGFQLSLKNQQSSSNVMSILYILLNYNLIFA
jgi:hypothetical protein